MNVYLQSISTLDKLNDMVCFVSVHCTAYNGQRDQRKIYHFLAFLTLYLSLSMSFYLCFFLRLSLWLSLTTAQSLFLSPSLVMTSIAQLIEASYRGRYPVQASAMFLNELSISLSFFWFTLAVSVYAYLSFLTMQILGIS